jgi:BlaI family transcriptional regulator, penicillinase repressor
MKPRPSIDLSDGEWVIIQAVWEREPCAAPDIQEALQPSKGWAYSTVRTMMDRMAAKGLLTTEKIRHMTLYRAAVTRPQAQRSELLQTLKRAFDGALTPMVQCMLDTKELNARELAELERLIQQKRKETGEK